MSSRQRQEVSAGRQQEVSTDRQLCSERVISAFSERVRRILLKKLQDVAARNHLLREQRAFVCCSSFPVLGGVPGARPLEQPRKERAGKRQCRKCQSNALPKNFGFCAVHRKPMAARPEKPPAERLEYYRWSYLRFARVSVLKHLVHCHQYSRYLEVGADCGQCFSRIARLFAVAHSVDIVKLFSGLTHCMSSDEFFCTAAKDQYDLIFIDGLHLEEQVDKDIANALICLQPGGTIVLHDCSPPTAGHASDPRSQ